MTAAEIVVVTTLLREAAVPGEWSPDKAKIVASYLSVLPFEWAMTNARVWAGQPKLDPQGREQPKFLNTLPEVLAAVGVKATTVPDIVRAMKTGAQMMPDLRALDGLTLVGPTDPLPQGVYEYLHLNKLPVPRRPVAPALAAPEAPVRPVHDWARDLAARVREDRRIVRPPPSKVIEAEDALMAMERAGLDQPVMDAIRRLVDRVASQITALEDQRVLGEERLADLERSITGEDPDLEGLLEVVRRIARRTRGTHPGALAEVLTAAAEGFAPELQDARVTVVRADPVTDLGPPVRVVVDLRRKEPKPDTPRKAQEPSVKMPVRFGISAPR